MTISLTGSSITTGAAGPIRAIELDVAMDNSYPTGGETVAGLTALLADKTVKVSIPDIIAVGGTTRKFKINKTTKLLQAFEATDVEVANGVDLSGWTSVKPIVIVE